MPLHDIAAFGSRTLNDATIAELPNHYRGKVRDNYDLSDGRRIIIASDRLSAFDQIRAVPFKGEVLTQTARFWFEKTADICSNHVLEYPDPNVLILPAPGHPAGRDRRPRYLAERRALPSRHATRLAMNDVRDDAAGRLRDNQRLPEPIITPTSKEF